MCFDFRWPFSSKNYHITEQWQSVLGKCPFFGWFMFTILQKLIIILIRNGDQHPLLLNLPIVGSRILDCWMLRLAQKNMSSRHQLFCIFIKCKDSVCRSMYQDYLELNYYNYYKLLLHILGLEQKKIKENVIYYNNFEIN